MREKDRKVIVLGKGSLAIQVAEYFLKSSDYDLTQIVPSMPEPTWQPSLTKWAEESNVEVIESGHYKDLPSVKDSDWSIDLAVSVTYNRIIKSWFINKCNKIINIHNGPLPRYRGVSPINWALKNNETSHGVTIHEITPGIDDGPIISQVNFSVFPEDDEVEDIYYRCLNFGWELFKQTIPNLDRIKPQPQDENQATYYDLSKNELLGERRDFTREKSRQKH